MTAPAPSDVAPALPDWQAYYTDVWFHCGSTLRIEPAIPYHKLRFHKVEAGSLNRDGMTVLGTTRGRDIYIVADLWTWPVVVRHEMLHAQYGVPGHPPVFAHCDSISAGL